MKKTIRVSRGMAVLVLAASLLLQGAPARADDSTAREAGLGAAAALSSLVYGPAKLIYAGFGLMLSGAAWLWTGGDNDVARPIYIAAVRGDYVLTPDHLTARKPIEFVGRPAVDRPQVAAPPPYYEEGF